MISILYFTILPFTLSFSESNSVPEILENKVFCEHMFHKSVRKQLLWMNLTDLSTYVKINPGMYTKEDGSGLIVIFGKDNLVVIKIQGHVEESGTIATKSNLNLIDSSGDYVNKRDMYTFKEFIKEAEGSNCFTSLILPYVIVMCDQSTYVFKPENGYRKQYSIAFPGLSIAAVPISGQKQYILMFQKISEGRIVFMEKLVNMEASKLDLGIPADEVNQLTDSEFQEKIQKKHKFLYLLYISDSPQEAVLSKLAKLDYNSYELPVLFFPLDLKTILFSTLNSKDKPFHQVEYPIMSIQGKEIDKWALTKVEIDFGSCTPEEPGPRPEEPGPRPEDSTGSSNESQTKPEESSFQFPYLSITIAIVMISVVIVIIGMLIVKRSSKNHGKVTLKKARKKTVKKLVKPKMSKASSTETHFKVTSQKIKDSKNKIDTSVVNSLQSSKTQKPVGSPKSPEIEPLSLESTISNSSSKSKTPKR